MMVRFLAMLTLRGPEILLVPPQMAGHVWYLVWILTPPEFKQLFRPLYPVVLLFLQLTLTLRPKLQLLVLLLKIGRAHV